MRRLVSAGLALAIAAGLIWWCWRAWEASEEQKPPAQRPRIQAGRATVGPRKPLRRAMALVTASAPPPSEDADGIIEGMAYLYDGSPASEADVRVSTDGYWMPEKTLAESKPSSAVADAAGVFAVTGLPCGGYKIVARKGDCMAIDGARISPTAPVWEVTLMLTPCSALAGTTVDPAGIPVPGVILMPVENDGRVLPLELGRALETQSGPDGRFLFEALKPVSWRLRAEAPDFATLITEPLQAGQSNAVIRLSRGGSVLGVCLNASDEAPCAGISVLARRELAREPEKTTTDAAGRFAFEMLAPDTYLLLPEDGRLTTVDGPVRARVTEGGAVPDIVLRLEVAGIVRGRVYDKATNSGIAGATVRASFQKSEPPHFPSCVSEHTGVSGDYEIHGLGPGLYRLSCALPEGAPAQLATAVDRSVSVSPGCVLENVDFGLSRGTFIRGVVVDKQGQPLPYAQVDSSQGPDCKARCNAAGEFALEVRPNQDVTITARTRELFSEPHGPYRAGPEGLNDIRVVAGTGLNCLIAGYVVNTLNQPTRAWVKCVPAGVEALLHPRLVESDSEGRFLIPELASADYDLQVGRSVLGHITMSCTAATVHLNPGQKLTGVRLVLDESGVLTISGRVQGEDGAPVPYAMMWAISDNDRIQHHSDDQGNYELRGLSEGVYQMWVRETPPYGKSKTRLVEAGSQGVDFVLPRLPSIEGRVVDARTGAPVTEFEVASVRSETPSSEQLNGAFQQVSDPEGRFVLDGVRGICVILVRARGYFAGTLNLGIVRTGQTYTGLRIALKPGGAPIEGQVCDPDGGAVANALIFLGGVTRPYDAHKAVATTDRNGAFQLDPSMVPVSGEVMLSAFAPGHSLTSVFVAAGAGPVELVLLPESVISGMVTCDGRPAGGAYVYADVPQVGSPGATSDSDGHYHIGQLPPGTYAVRASLLQEGRKPLELEEQVELWEGCETPVDFEFAIASQPRTNEPDMEGEQEEQQE